MKRHYPALRGVVIFLVVLHHAIVLGTSIPADWGYRTAGGNGANILTVISLFGWVAVPVFLFLSGSFYAYAAQGTPPKISTKVVVSNLSRLIWPYVIWSIFFYLVLWLGRGATFTAFGYLKNLITGYPYNFVPLILFYILISPAMVWVANRIGWAPVLLVIGAYQVFLIFAVDSVQYELVFPAWTNRFIIPVLSRTLADWGIYFPLGLAMTLKSSHVTPMLERMKWVFIIAGLVFFGLTAAHALRLVRFPLSRHLFPFMFVFTAPVIKKEQIPLRKTIEWIGKHAYGLYLAHLVVIDAVMLVFRGTIPWLLDQPYLIHLTLLILATGIPLVAMELINRSKLRKISPYLFG